MARAARKVWKPEEDAILREKFPTMSTRELADQIGRRVGSVCHRAHRLALRNEPNSESETSSRIPAGVARANRLEESTRRNGGAEKGLSTGKDLGAPINGHARTATA